MLLKGYVVSKVPFIFADIESDCVIETGHYRLDGRSLGMRITVPEVLMSQSPYNCSAYDLLQQLREQIFAYGLVEFPNLPLNPQNHTLAQRAPQQHAHSSNTYMTDYCQNPHQDTPPYPTAFRLDMPRQYFATWVISEVGVDRFYRRAQGLAAAELTALPKSKLLA